VTAHGRDCEFATAAGSRHSVCGPEDPAGCYVVRRVQSDGEVNCAAREARLVSTIGRPSVRFDQISVCSEISNASST
jgi:hypothetical protein